MRKRMKLGLCIALAWTAWAGPVDFGKQELDRAIAVRKLSARRFRVQTDVSTGSAESFRILPGLISGGDMRGLMYGLIEAAEQVRDRGYLLAAKAAPATRIRGVRILVQPEDLQQDWYNSRAGWQEFCATLARSRLNRLNLVFAQQTTTAIAADRNVEMLRFISQTATDYAVDFTLGLETGGSEPDDNGALKHLLASCPTIRGVQASFFRNWLFRAAREAGRRVTVELRESDLTPDRIEEARNAALPLRIARSCEAAFVAARDPGAYDVVCVVSPGRAGPNPRPAAALVRQTVASFSQPGCAGFEIDAPTPPPGENDGLFYLLWGRLSYNPKTPDTMWSKEMKAR